MLSRGVYFQDEPKCTLSYEHKMEVSQRLAIIVTLCWGTFLGALLFICNFACTQVS